MRIKSIIVFFLFSFFFKVLPIAENLGGALFAQSNNFVTFGVEEGLIQSHVQSLLQDNGGNLWVGTIGGITCYNGTKFINYTQENGLSEDWISVSLKDKNGNLWFGHWGGGITVYDEQHKKFVDLKSEVYNKYKKITSLTEDKNGNIYAGTENSGIEVYKSFSEMKFTGMDSAAHPPKPEMIDEGLGSNNITALYADAQNKLWVGTNNGISIYDISGKKTTDILSSSNGFPDNSIQCIVPVFRGEVWVGTENAGIVRMKIEQPFFQNTDAGAIQRITMANGLSSNNIKTIFEDKEHIVWLGTKDAGILQFLPADYSLGNTGFTQGEINIFSSKFEMKYYNANVFFQDRESNIWIGTEIGLHRYTGELFRIYNHSDGLTTNLVWSILNDSRGDLWFGTTDGVSRFTFPSVNGKKQYSNPLVKNYTVAEGLSDNLVISMYEDSKGNIWFGTQNNGVCVLTKETKKLRGQETEVEVFKKYSVKEGLIDNNIFSIAEDKDGSVWFGTRNGASQMNPQTSEIKNFTTADGLGGNKVYKILRDRKNNLWFGILGGYLTKYDGNTFKTFGEAEGVNQKFILSMDEDKEGNLWFGAYGAGIIRYDGKEFKSFSSEQGLSSNSPLFIICDDENNLWIGQSRGIEKYDKQSGRFMLYARQQGFPGVETNENAIAKDKDGNIWFGAIKGAVKFSPKKEKISKTEPLTAISGLKLFLKEISLADDTSFSYNENYLTFFALAVCLTNPKDVLYQYKLDGFDAGWMSPTVAGSITYSNLPPGKYTFMAKASNGENVWNENPATFSFAITPPFWETWWFRISALAFILSAITGFIIWREKKLKQEKKILENKVDERTRELRKEKEIVEKQNTEIHKKNLNITESIGYAKRIQQAVLPPIDVIGKIFPESFVFYKPKDIVSGDFYWIHELGNKVLFAAVDCTGHGVPGAFMSIIGNNILEQITREQKSHEPAMILNQLGKEVALTLRKSAAASIKDGMDIALCSLDKISNSLEFAGAGNSLYIINPKRTAWAREAVPFPGGLPGAEIKADRQSIGAHTDNKPFNNNKIQLQKGDMVYIFSDGYPDQKGGPDKKKFYYAPFRKLLCEIYHLPVAEQRKHLKETILKWMGGAEQYDDMLIFGVRI